MADIATARREASMSFDREANEKDLVGRNRRGVESAIEYDMRRRAGIPPKNERDDPRSPYSRENIEDGLMTRESNNGIEYGAFWDKDGELIAIYKGDKGSVGAHIEGEKVKGGMMTHSHPTEFDANGNPKRPFGYAFSAGDINVHAVRELAETRAVAREGTYAFSTDGARVEIPKSILSQLPPSVQSEYGRLGGTERQALALKVLALCQTEGSPYNPIERALREVVYQAAGAKGVSPNSGTAFNSAMESKDFLIRQGVYQKRLFEEFGVKWQFKAAKGFEDVGRAIASGDDQGGQTDFKSDTGAYQRSVPRTTSIRPSIIGSDGKRSELVLRTYRDADQPRTAPPPQTAPKVTTAKSVGSAPKPATATAPKKAPPVKPAVIAPALGGSLFVRPIDPPTRGVRGGVILGGVGVGGLLGTGSGGIVGGVIQRPNLPSAVFGN
jgi:hypothetical protein